MALTDVRVRSAKAKEKPYKLADVHGLYLLVTVAGTKLWRWKYRFDRREKLMALGSYPDTSLSVARDSHAAGRRMLASGVDPMAAKGENKPGLDTILNPFREVATAWYEKWKVGKDERYLQSVERRLTDDVITRIGDRPIDEIQAPEIVAVICEIEKRGASDVARRAHQMTSQIFRYGIAHGLAKQNPASMFRPGDVLRHVEPVNFPRLDKAELPDLLKKIEYYPGSPVTRLAMKLMALVFLRTDELIKGEWSEVNFEEARWDRPKERMKGGKRPHIVPLSRQAAEVLRELRHYRKNEHWIFPGDHDADKCMSNNTILGALDRMGYKGRMTGHGFRGVASTLLHEQGFEHEHIELQLAHAPKDDVSAAYNYAKYLRPRVEMMQWWADALDKIRVGGTIPMPRETQAHGH